MAGIAHKLVQGSQGFALQDLLEMRVFEHYLAIHSGQITLNEEQWQNAKQRSDNYLAGSCHLSLLHNIIKSFELAQPKRKYVSDWRMFIQESCLEDFYHAEKGVVMLSTIHKSKGREFDHVFVLIDKNSRNHTPDDARKREFYVAFSRAKSDLMVLSNDDALLELLPKDHVNHLTHQGTYQEKRELILHLGHKDVYLNRFYDFQVAVRRLQAGADLRVSYLGCFDENNEQVLAFSNKFKNELTKYTNKGYQLNHAKVNFVALWHAQDRQEIRIVLPIIHLSKTTT